MSFANRLSSNKCTVSTVYPKPKSGPKRGPVGFSFNARQTKNGFEYPFWLHFSTRYHSFSSLHRVHSAVWDRVKSVTLNPIEYPFWLQFFTIKQTKNGFNTNLMTKNREWHALSQTKKYWTNNKTKQIWTNFSQLSHKELIFMNSWPVRNGIKNLILSLFCNNFYGILNPPKKFFLESHLKKFPSGQLFFMIF